MESKDSDELSQKIAIDILERGIAKGRKDGIRDFAEWCYIHGICFDFMGHLDIYGKSDVPERISNIIKEYEKEQKK